MEFAPIMLAAPGALGSLVRQRRRSQHLRIDDVAALVGVSVDLMSRLENSQGSVRLDKALAVLDGLGLTLLVVPKEHAWALSTGSMPVSSKRGQIV